MNYNYQYFKKIAAPLTRLSLLLLLAVNLILLISYLFINYKNHFHSDSAAKVLLAREIIACRDFFVNDWNYCNQDIWVFAGHLYAIPLGLFIPLGYTAHAISGLISAAILLTAVYLVLQLNVNNVNVKILVLTAFAGGISGLMAENMYGQFAYGTTFWKILLVSYVSWLTLVAEENERWKYSLGLSTILILFTWPNPVRALLNYQLPLFVTICYLYIKNSKIEFSKNVFSVFLSAISSILVGYYLHKWTLAGVNNIEGVSDAKWLSFDQMIGNFMLILRGGLAIFGANPLSGGKVVSSVGLYEAFRLFIAICAILIIPITLFRLIANRCIRMQFFGMFGMALLIPVLFLTLTTTIVDTSDPIQASRYLVPAISFALITFAFQPINRKHALYSWCIITILIGLSLSGYINLKKSDIYSSIQVDQSKSYNSTRIELVEMLKKSGLKYGYATYWNAGVLSALSDESVLVRQIIIVNGVPMPFRHLSSNRWYNPDFYSGKTFLLLTDAESKSIRWDFLDAFGCRPMDVISHKGYKIYVFAENISNFFPDWHGNPNLLKNITLNELKKTGSLNRDLMFKSWSTPEGEFRWSLGKSSEIFFKVGNPFLGKGDLHISGNTFQNQRIIVLLNDSLVYSGKGDGQIQKIDINGLSNKLKQGINKLTIETPDARIPGTADTRVLGFAIREIELK